MNGTKTGLFLFLFFSFELFHLAYTLILSDCQLQSTLVISKSKGLSEILRDIRISTYQICRIEEKR